jgi:hypothetical protein
LLTEAELVGAAAAEQLLERGAADILADVNKAQARIEGPRP